MPSSCATGPAGKHKSQQWNKALNTKAWTTRPLYFLTNEVWAHVLNALPCLVTRSVPLMSKRSGLTRRGRRGHPIPRPPGPGADPRLCSLKTYLSIKYEGKHQNPTASKCASPHWRESIRQTRTTSVCRQKWWKSREVIHDPRSTAGNDSAQPARIARRPRCSWSDWKRESSPWILERFPKQFNCLRMRFTHVCNTSVCDPDGK